MTKSIISIIILLIAGVVSVYLMFTNLEAFSAFGVALLLAAIAIALLWAVDTFLLHGWDTIEEIKNGNIAAGLALVAYAIIIASSMLSAFLVWK